MSQTVRQVVTFEADKDDNIKRFDEIVFGHSSWVRSSSPVILEDGCMDMRLHWSQWRSG